VTRDEFIEKVKAGSRGKRLVNDLLKTLYAETEASDAGELYDKMTPEEAEDFVVWLGEIGVSIDVRRM
jgi:hypothetical protein